ncbi:histidinol-phosphatase HisJ family protein [bacterium]|nr:histidinol-phosphatase HisJ family protein [bacterium]
MLADYHLHTHNSDDSKIEMHEYAEKALELEFDELCYTDHKDFDVTGLGGINAEKYLSEYRDVLEKFDGKLSIKLGAEFGMQIFNTDKFEKLFSSLPLDFVILSFHTVDGKMLWNKDFFDGRTQQEYNERYYQEIIDVTKVYKNYSVLGHLDLIRRYDTSYYPFEKVKSFIAEILKQIINDGKGLEVNTSCFRYKIPDLTPSVDILNLYKDLGGEILTIGSDSHSTAHFGFKIAEVQKQLKELGFKHFYTFDKMIPLEHNLV